MGTSAAVQAMIPAVHSFRIVRSAASLRDASLKTVQCGACSLREQCLPGTAEADDLAEIMDAAQGRRRIKRGEVLYQAGETFRGVYAVRLGFFKSYTVTEDGRSQIMGFQMGGDLLGLDGLDSEAHTMTVTALEDGEVCVFPYAQIERSTNAVMHQLHRAMSREIVRQHGLMMLLGTMRAEERVATFLLNLSTRFNARGYAASEFNLRMTREEIGSYLGLKLETVSRILSKFQDAGLIVARNRYVKILNRPGLSELTAQSLE